MHLAESTAWDDLANLSTDLAFLEAKAEADLVVNLLADLNRAADKLAAMRHPEHDRIRLLARALVADLSFVAAHPTSLFQCLWNRCWWHDCPQAADHYEQFLEEMKPPPWQREGPKLHELMERWEQEKRLSGRLWLRSLRPPADPPSHPRLHGHLGPVFGVAVSPDGSRLATCSRDGTVRIWGASNSKDVRSPAGWTAIRTIQFSEASTEEERIVAHEKPFHPDSVAFTPDGKMVACGSRNARSVKVWKVDSASDEPVTCRDGHSFDASRVEFSLDGTLFASGSFPDIVRVWEIQSGNEVLCSPGHKSVVNGVAFSPDGKRLASAAGDGVHVWDTTKSLQEEHLRRMHTGLVTAVTFSHHGNRLASVGHDQKVCIWNLETGQVTMLRVPDHVYFTAVAFSPDDRQIATGSNDGIVRRWDVESGAPLADLEGHGGEITCLSFFPKGGTLASSSLDASVIVWDLSETTLALRRRGEDSLLQTVSTCYFPSGKFLATSGSQAVRIWDTCTGRHVSDLEDTTTAMQVATRMAIGPVAPHLLAAGDCDGTVRVWQVSAPPLPSIQPVWRSRPHGKPNGKPIECIAFSHDGTLLASGGWDNQVRIWNTCNDKPLHVCPGHSDVVRGLAFSRDGKVLASCSDDRTVGLWDVATGETLSTDRFGPVYCVSEKLLSVALSIDGRWLAAGTRNYEWSEGFVYLWDLQKTVLGEQGAILAEEPVQLQGHRGNVDSLCFSEDSRRLASGATDDNEVRVWDTQTSGCQFVLGALYASETAFGAAARSRWQRFLQGSDTQLRFPETGAVLWLAGVLRLIQNPTDDYSWAGPESPGARICFYRIEGGE
jgi:WD40 repeat protein